MAKNSTGMNTGPIIIQGNFTRYTVYCHRNGLVRIARNIV